MDRNNSILEYLDNKYHNSFKINHNMNIKIFAEKLSPFIVLVNYWSQILGYVIYRCDDPLIRKKIIENLVDENCGEMTHVESFKNFLTECGFNKKIETNKTVLKYKDMLQLHVLTNNYKTSCAILGAIEYVYHMISKTINKYFSDKMGYTPSNHYTTHEIVDIKHATDLFDCTDQLDVTFNDCDIGAQWIICCLTELLYVEPLFGHTYEDLNVELQAIDMCDNPSSGLMILSGGDTMFEIANKIKKITAVDCNLGQIELVNEKIHHLKNGSYESFIKELELRDIVYCDLFKKVKTGNYSYDDVFCRESLKEKFGLNAVKHTNINFPKYFEQVANKTGKYQEWIFDRDFKQKINQSASFDIRAIQLVDIVHDFIENKLIDDSYDFIQTSNVTDWMNHHQYVKFCEKLKLSLKVGGVLIMRRLASTNLLAPQFPNSINVHDQTNLYSETIIWKKT